MTIDKNEPDDVPADDKNDEQSPKPKEITEKVTTTVETTTMHSAYQLNYVSKYEQ